MVAHKHQMAVISKTNRSVFCRNSRDVTGKIKRKKIFFSMINFARHWEFNNRYNPAVLYNGTLGKEVLASTVQV
jgi:hypothetical protein